MRKISSLKIGFKELVDSKKIYFFLGAGLSQVFALLTSFYILKYANAKIYGSFSYFLSIAMLIGSLATLKFEQSIVISKTITDSNEKLILTIQTSFFLSLITIAIFSLFDKSLGIIELVLCVILSISVALNASLQQGFVFLEKHIYNGLLGSVYAFLNLLLIIFFIKIPNGLQIAYSSAYLAAGLIFSIAISKLNFEFKILSISKYRRVFKEQFSFVKYVFPGAILTILLTYGHPILIKYIYSENELGLFSLSLRILLLPSILVGSVLGALFRKRLSELYFKGEYDSILIESKKILKYLLLIAILIYPIILLILTRINDILNLSGWYGIGKVSSILVFYAISQLLYIPLTNVLLVYEKKNILLNLNIIQFLITAFIYICSSYYHFSFYSFLIFLNVTTSLFTMYAIYRILFIAKTCNRHINLSKS